MGLRLPDGGRGLPAAARRERWRIDVVHPSL
jgi:hypothetical protein